eukprot:Skav210618  [mRNA]  locus=scaffold234:377365:382195:- [translate_table: standard]
MLRRCFSFLENFQLEAINAWRLNSEVEEVSIYERLRSEFREINPENKRYLTILDFFKGVKGCAQVAEVMAQGSGRIPAEQNGGSWRTGYTLAYCHLQAQRN